MKQIEIAVDDRVQRVPFETLIEYQGDIKELSGDNCEKLKKRILSVGFCDPFVVWDSSEGMFILDGHQRKLALSSLSADGWKIPPVPVVCVAAETHDRAKEIVLSLTSQFGEFNTSSETMAKWLESFESDIADSFRFVDTEINFNLDFDFGDVPEEEEPQQKKRETECPHCGEKFII